MTQLTIHSTRSGSVESVHRVSAAIVNEAGDLVASSGDAEFLTIARSTAKPFQALPLVQDGVVERFGISPGELALACASHNSELTQVEIVKGLLDRIECTPDDLACGPHKALAATYSFPPVDRDLVASPSPLSSNCSGKHTGMLALARHHGWSTEGYNRSGHPVQQRIKQELSRWTDLEADSIVEGEDGCTAVTFALPLYNMALAMARLGASTKAAPRTIVSAMTENPLLVAGRGRLESELMAEYGGQIVAKVGAEGVYIAALPVRRLGMALKVEDGHALCAMIALVSVLDQLGLDPPPSTVVSQFARYPVDNTRGASVGALEPSGELEFE
jgi:L-asparaginase II